jgi:hypothetical protein
LFLLNALFFAYTGAWCVVRLEIADAHPSALRTGSTDGNSGMRCRESKPTVLLPNPFVSR